MLSCEEVLNVLKSLSNWKHFATCEGSLAPDKAVDLLNSYFSDVRLSWHHIFQRNRFHSQHVAPP